MHEAKCVDKEYIKLTILLEKSNNIHNGFAVVVFMEMGHSLSKHIRWVASMTVFTTI